MGTIWRWLGDAMIGVHFTFLAYLIVGGFLAWRWRRTIGLHVVAAIWGVLIITTKVPCPLTELQNTFRERAGQSPLEKGFIDAYVRGHLYPIAHETLVQAAVGLIVVVSWVGFLARTRRRTPVGSAA